MQTMREWTAHSWDEFLKHVEDAESYLRSLDGNQDSQGEKEFWYRGHEKSSYTLTASLFRYENGKEQEEELFRSYTRTNLQEPNRKDDAWETLFDMQHYGVPTRLLDWTKVLGIAAYFAVTPNAEDPCVYILDPERLNQKSGRASVVNVPDVGRYDYQTVYWKKDPFLHTHPLAISPTFQNERLQRQRGTFTVNGLNKERLEKQSPDCLCRVNLDRKACDEALQFLTIANLNAFNVFPDLVGMAPFVKNEANLKPLKYDLATAEQIKAKLATILEGDRRTLLEQSEEGAGNSGLYIKGIRACTIGDSFIRRGPEEEKLVNWLEEDHGKPCMFVSGEAGIGKTNFLLHTVLFNAAFQQRSTVFFSMKLYDRESSEHLSSSERRNTLQNLIFDYILGEDASAFDKSVAETMIHEGQIVLILDGLDELARVTNQKAIEEVGHQLSRLIGRSSKAKVIVSCRSHILNRLKGVGVVNPRNAFDFLKLGRLEEDQVRTMVQGHLGGSASDQAVVESLVPLARIPIFYQLIKQIPREEEWLSGAKGKEERRSALYEFWFNTALNHCGFDNLEAQKYRIGQVAGKMLEGRSDLIELESLSSDKRELVRKLSERPFPVFVEELRDTFAFSHQSLREFILAWSAHEEIRKGGEFLVLSKSSSFDYVSAETLRHLAGLIDFKGDLVDRMIELAAGKKLSSRQLSNVLFNLLEAVGMLAPSEEGLLLPAIREVLKIVKPRQRGDSDYIYFRTRYTAARCLVRLHPSAPKPYYKHVLGSEWLNRQADSNTIHAYAIRGFHLTTPKPGIWPPMVFEDHDECSVVSNMETEVSNCLLRTIENVNDIELPRDAEFLIINCTFALIRWLPKEFNRTRLKRLLLKGSLCRRAKTNIFWSLYRIFREDVPETFNGLFNEIRLPRQAPQDAKNTLDRLTS